MRWSGKNKDLRKKQRISEYDQFIAGDAEAEGRSY